MTTRKDYDYRSSTHGGYFKRVIDKFHDGVNGAVYANTDVDAEILGSTKDNKISDKIKTDVINGLFKAVAAHIGESPNANISLREKVKLINDELGKERMSADSAKRICYDIAKSLNHSIKAGIDLEANPSSVCAATARKLAEFGLGLKGEVLAASETFNELITDLAGVVTILDSSVIPRCKEVVKGVPSEESNLLTQDCFNKIDQIVETIKNQVDGLKGLASGAFEKRASVVLQKLEAADLDGALAEIGKNASEGRSPGPATMSVVKLIRPIAVSTLFSKHALSMLDVNVADILKRRANGESLQNIVDSVVNAEIKSGKVIDQQTRDQLNTMLAAIARIYKSSAPTEIGPANAVKGGRDFEEREERYGNLGFAGGGIPISGRLQEELDEKNLRTKVKTRITDTDYLENSFRRQYTEKLRDINERSVDAVMSVYENSRKIPRNNEAYMRFDAAVSRIATQHRGYVIKLFSALGTHSFTLEEKSDYIRDLKRASLAVAEFAELLDNPKPMKRMADGISSLASFLEGWQESAINKKTAKQFYYGKTGGYDLEASVRRPEPSHGTGKEVAAIMRRPRNGQFTRSSEILRVKDISDFQRIVEDAIDRSEIRGSTKHTHTMENAIVERQKGLSNRFIAGYNGKIDVFNSFFSRFVSDSFIAENNSLRRAYDLAVKNAGGAADKLEEARISYEKQRGQLDRARISANEVTKIVQAQAESVQQLMKMMELMNVYVMNSIKEVSQITPSSTSELAAIVDGLRISHSRRDKTEIEQKISEIQTKIATSADRRNPYFAEIFEDVRKRSLEIFKRLNSLRSLLIIVDAIGPSAIKKVQTGTIMDAIADFISKTLLVVQLESNNAEIPDYSFGNVAKNDIEEQIKDIFTNYNMREFKPVVQLFDKYRRALRQDKLSCKLAYVNSVFLQKYHATPATVDFISAPDEAAVEAFAKSISIRLSEANEDATKLFALYLCFLVYDSARNRQVRNLLDFMPLRDQFVEACHDESFSISKMNLANFENVTPLTAKATRAEIKTFIEQITKVAPEPQRKLPITQPSDLYVDIFDVNDIVNHKYDDSFNKDVTYTVKSIDRTKATFTYNAALTKLANPMLVKKLLEKPNWIIDLPIMLGSSLHIYDSFSEAIRQFYSLTYSCRGGSGLISDDSNTAVYDIDSGDIYKGRDFKFTATFHARNFLETQSLFISPYSVENADEPNDTIASKSLALTDIDSFF
jgi:hypothetical protein